MNQKIVKVSNCGTFLVDTTPTEVQVMDEQGRLERLSPTSNKKWGVFALSSFFTNAHSKKEMYGRATYLYGRAMAAWEYSLPIPLGKIKALCKKAQVAMEDLLKAIQNMPYPTDLLGMSPGWLKQVVANRGVTYHAEITFRTYEAVRETLEYPRWVKKLRWPILPQKETPFRRIYSPEAERASQSKFTWMAYIWLQKTYGECCLPHSQETYTRFLREKGTRAYISYQNISDYLTYLHDGQRLAEMLGEDGRQVVGQSPSKALQAAAFNHRLEQLARQKEEAAKLADPTQMPTYGVELPPQWEALRLKTAGEMRRAGQECQHCIGSYAGRWSHTQALFFRKGDVCAQVTTERVAQCYDKGNTRTDASRKFEAELNREVVPLMQRALKPTTQNLLGLRF